MTLDASEEFSSTEFVLFGVSAIVGPEPASLVHGRSFALTMQRATVHNAAATKR